MTIARIATAKAKSAVKKLGLGPVQKALRAKELQKKTKPPKTKVDDTKKVQAEAAKGAATAKKGPQQRVTAQIRERTLGDVKKVPGYKSVTGRSKIANSDPVELGTNYSVKELKATEMAIKQWSTKRLKRMEELLSDPKKKLSLEQAWRQAADPSDSTLPSIKTLRRAIEYRQGLKSATASPSARPRSKGAALREKYRRGGGKVVSRKKGKKVISTKKPTNTVSEDYGKGKLNVQRIIRGKTPPDKTLRGDIKLVKPEKIKPVDFQKKRGGKIVYRSVSGKVLDGNELVAMIYKND